MIRSLLCSRGKICSTVTASVLQKECLPLLQSAGYKSHLSIDKIYPNSDPDFLRSKQSAPVSSENFTGYIPVEDIEITTTKSSGPGGQNVNKVNSKVEVRFHLQSASWIPDWVKTRLEEKEPGRITKDGFFVVRSDATRKQMLNRADCLDKLRHLIYQASVLPKEPTEEELKVKEERIAKAKAWVLREKKKRSLTKRSRSAEDF